MLGSAYYPYEWLCNCNYCIMWSFVKSKHKFLFGYRSSCWGMLVYFARNLTVTAICPLIDLCAYNFFCFIFTFIFENNWKFGWFFSNRISVCGIEWMFCVCIYVCTRFVGNFEMNSLFIWFTGYGKEGMRESVVSTGWSKSTIGWLLGIYTLHRVTLELTEGIWNSSMGYSIIA